MNRRGFCTGALTALSAAGSASAGQVQYRAAGANAADKDIRRTQLFLDDTWVDDTMRLQRTETHRYRLSVRFVELALANIYRFQQRFLWGASQPMQALARETESVVHLGHCMAVTCSSWPGPAHATSLGKVLLAFSGPEVIGAFIGPRRSFERLTPATIS